jgi:hypothetical protein
VNIEERKLADVLHRVTPEPPRPVTVEQVAYRLVSEPRLGRQTRDRGPAGPRPRRGGLALSRAFAPVMAAAAVVVIAGASAGIAVLANSHHNPPSATGGTPSSSPSQTSSSPSQTSSSPEQLTPGTSIAGGPWGAALIDQQTFDQESLVSGDGSLYAYSSGYLDRINPATGTIVATARYIPPLPNPPVIVGNTVWVVSSASGGNVVLHGYDAHTLAQTGSVQVPATGSVAAAASNVLTAGPDGHLYVAAGLAVVVADPATGNLIKRISLSQGSATSVAVSPDGTTLYVGVSPSSGGFELLVYNLASDTVAASSTLRGTASGGTLVATSGGVWGTTGVGMSEWTWFAPGGDLSRAVRIGQGAGAGLASVPSYSGGAVWVGGSHTLTCASPVNGRILDTATLPTDHSVIEYFSSPAIVGDHAYSIYQDNAAQRSGLVRMTPPAACSGNVSS